MLQSKQKRGFPLEKPRRAEDTVRLWTSVMEVIKVIVEVVLLILK